MKTLFLTSSVNFVAHNLAKKIDVKKYKKLAFINTAVEVEDGEKQWIHNDRESLIQAGFDVFDYTLTDKTHEQVKQDLSQVDTFYIEGGNTFSFD